MKDHTASHMSECPCPDDIFLLAGLLHHAKGVLEIEYRNFRPKKGKGEIVNALLL